MHITERQRVDVINAALDAYIADRERIGAIANAQVGDPHGRAMKDAMMRCAGAARTIRGELASVDMPRFLDEAMRKGAATRNRVPRGPGPARPQIHMPA